MRPGKVVLVKKIGKEITSCRMYVILLWRMDFEYGIIRLLVREVQETVKLKVIEFQK